MADMSPPAVGGWQQATVVEIRRETATAKTFRLKLVDSHPHLPGQHYVVRLSAPDGYRAQRSYSVASAPQGPYIELTVESLPDGEVSGFLNEVVTEGDELEVRGPIGGFFAWDGRAPVLGVGGGSGVVPLMSMSRQARAVGRPDLVRLVVSVRSPDELYYAAELAGTDATIVYTRQVPPAWSRQPGRLTSADIAGVVDPGRMAFVCGSPGFCDAVTGLLIASGTATSLIRVERFGPTG
jgi:ferredoxin-NADP reductase